MHNDDSAQVLQVIYSLAWDAQLQSSCTNTGIATWAGFEALKLVLPDWVPVAHPIPLSWLYGAVHIAHIGRSLKMQNVLCVTRRLDTNCLFVWRRSNSDFQYSIGLLNCPVDFAHVILAPGTLHIGRSLEMQNVLCVTIDPNANFQFLIDLLLIWPFECQLHILSWQPELCTLAGIINPHQTFK